MCFKTYLVVCWYFLEDGRSDASLSEDFLQSCGCWKKLAQHADTGSDRLVKEVCDKSNLIEVLPSLVIQE